jgi:uncharacterized protein (TIGR03000 family)
MIVGAGLAVAGLVLLGIVPVRAESLDGRSNKASVIITMMVPEDAVVFFDGAKTTQTGTQRTFHSPPISRGTTSKYEIDVVADGQEKLKVKRAVEVRGGERVTLDCRGGRVREVRGATTSSTPSYQPAPISVPASGPRVVPFGPRWHVVQPYGFGGGVGDG